MSNPQQLLSAMNAMLDFIEADAVNPQAMRALASLIADDDGIGHWHKNETRPIVNELLTDIYATFSRYLLCKREGTDYSGIGLDKLRGKLQLLSKYTVSPRVNLPQGSSETDQQVYDRVLGRFNELVESGVSHQNVGVAMAKLPHEDLQRYRRIASRKANVADDLAKHFVSKSKKARLKSKK